MILDLITETNQQLLRNTKIQSQISQQEDVKNTYNEIVRLEKSLNELLEAYKLRIYFLPEDISQSVKIDLNNIKSSLDESKKDFLESGHEQDEIFIAFTHFHWDHIQGFPFFAPAFNKNQKINMLALGWGRRLKCLEDIFRTQMQKEYFPVQLEKMGAKFEFMLLRETKKVFEPDVPDPKPVTVKVNKHKHPGSAYGYRIERD